MLTIKYKDYKFALVKYESANSSSSENIELIISGKKIN
jgi:hypothetical protein